LGLRPIVNPAPAQPLPPALMALGPLLTPNEHELLTTGGSADPGSALASLAAQGAQVVVVTRGALGALLVDGERRVAIPSRPVEVVDATGAGDTFSGVLAAWLAEGRTLAEAVEAANAAAGLSVTRRGAREGMPSRLAIEAALQG